MSGYMMNSKNQQKLLVIAAVLLACIHNYLFYGNPPGISFPLFVIIFYTYVFTFTKQQLRLHSLPGWLLFAVIMLLSMTYVLFNNPIFYALNFLIIPVLIFTHITFIGSDRKPDWWNVRLIIYTLDHLIPQSFRHFATAFRVLKSEASSNVKQEHKSVVYSMLIGLLIAIPLLILVISLLASADLVFEHFVMELPNWFVDVSFAEGITRFIWVFIWFLLLFGYVRGFIDTYRYRWNDGMPLEHHVPSKVTIDSIIMTTVLICMNIVYLLFVVVQFTYLFSAWDGIIPEGTTLAEHARSGFFELVFVTMINFVILIGVLVFERKDRKVINKLNSIMLTLLVGCSSIMLYSGYIRLHLYEQAYGYTYIRFLVHGFMIYLAAMLIVAGITIWLKKISLVRSFIMISLLAYVTVNYIGMDRMIAQKNIERYEHDGKIDQYYLTNLSTDAIPLIINSSQSGVNMDEYLHNEYDRLHESERNWTSFNYSRYRAERDLKAYFDMKSN
jgi:hypothetical protein